MGLDVLLEILGALEGLSTEVALVWLQGNVDTNVRGDVVALDRCGTARVPLACQIEVVGALPANVPLTDVVLLSSLVSCVVRNNRYYRGLVSNECYSRLQRLRVDNPNESHRMREDWSTEMMPLNEK